jgi:hypothetical protein
MVAGMAMWLGCLYLETGVNPMLYGLGASVAGLLLGNGLWKQGRQKT